MSNVQIIGEKWVEFLNNSIITFLRSFAVALWYVEKFIAGIIDRVVSGSLWTTLTDTMMATLKTNTPDMLRLVLFGNGTTMGLLYLACFFVSLSLIVPVLAVQGQKIARLEHVVTYMVFITILFLPANTMGFDLIGEIEKMRQGVSQTVTGSFAIGGLSALVADPMQATAADMTLDEVALPPLMAARYYPPATTTTRHSVTFFETLAGCHICFDVDIETFAAREARREAAGQGLIITILNLLPTTFVVLLGAVSLMLTASAWVLILFFIFSIPIGLFEFGSAIQGQIATRYIFIWSLTILVSGLSGVVAGLARTQFAMPDPNAPFGVMMDGLAVYTVMMALAILLIWYVVQIAYRTMTSSFDAVQGAVRTSFYPLASGSPPGRSPHHHGPRGGAHVNLPPVNSRPALLAPAVTVAALAAPILAHPAHLLSLHMPHEKHPRKRHHAFQTEDDITKEAA